MFVLEHTKLKKEKEKCKFPKIRTGAAFKRNKPCQILHKNLFVNPRLNSMLGSHKNLQEHKRLLLVSCVRKIHLLMGFLCPFQ